MRGHRRFLFVVALCFASLLYIAITTFSPMPTGLLRPDGTICPRPTVCANEWYTMVLLATSRGNVAMVKALLGAGATAGLSAALEVAIASREPDLIQLLSASRDGERDV